MNRIHIIKSKNTQTVTTYCGMVGFIIHNRSGASESEFDSNDNSRFEAILTIKGANCKRCLASHKRGK